jgi:hypothetical protein
MMGEVVETSASFEARFRATTLPDNAPYGGGRQWSMLLPDSRLISVPGAAHMSWVEAPELIFSSIDTFLNGDWPASSKKVNALEPVGKM